MATRNPLCNIAGVLYEMPVGDTIPSTAMPPGTGTVTSVALTAPTEITVGGSPVTGSGTLALTWTNESANKFFAGPTTGAATTPTFRSLVAADVGLTTKGDLISFSTVISRVGIGADTTVLTADSASTSGMKWAAPAAGTTSLGIQPGGRLTLTTGVPVTTSDVTGAATIYYTPYKTDQIELWDGSKWVSTTFTEQSLALGTLASATIPNDVFGFLNAGVLNIEKLIWTSTTARATAITIQGGRYCKSGDKTRLYLGTFCPTATTTTEDSGGGTSNQVGGKRFVWNMYNRVYRFARVIDTTDSWAYTTNTTRQANVATGNKVEAVTGLIEDAVDITVRGVASVFANSLAAAKMGVGINSTTVFSGIVQGGFSSAAATATYTQVGGQYRGLPTLGYSAYNWLEKGADSNCTFIGDNGGDGQQTGLSAEFWA